MGSTLLAIWVIWLLIDGVVAGGIAVRQFQLWRGAERGNRLSLLIVFIFMAGWSVGGFIWIAALGSLGDVRLPRQYTILMLVARSCGSIPVWLWLGMLTRGIREGQLRASVIWVLGLCVPVERTIRTYAIQALVWILGRFTRVERLSQWRDTLKAASQRLSHASMTNRWREALLEVELDISQHVVASGELEPDFWRREFREAIRDELDVYFGHKPKE